MSRHELDHSRTSDSSGKRHRWTFVDDDPLNDGYVLHETLEDTFTTAKLLTRVTHTEQISVGTFLFSDINPRAKNKLQEILEQRGRNTSATRQP